jgi:hypothetical protein
VALTRGRSGNHLYLTVAGDGDPHTVITRDALLPPTAVDVLAGILARDGSAISATSTLRQNADPFRRLGQAAAGHDPHAVLDAAIAARELDTAVDPAAVLDWRLDPSDLRTDRPGPLSWLPGVPDVLAADPAWAPSLPGRSRQVGDLAEQVGAVAGEWTPTTAPVWARPLLDTARD